jgi:hypothetical protein
MNEKETIKKLKVELRKNKSLLKNLREKNRKSEKLIENQIILLVRKISDITNPIYGDFTFSAREKVGRKLVRGMSLESQFLTGGAYREAQYNSCQ